MSAFCDLWFGIRQGNKPKYVRQGNDPWVERAHEKITYWQSNPFGVSNYPFVSEVDDGNYRLIILGQLYEDLSKGSILNRCVKYVEDGQHFEDPAGHYILFLLDKKGEQLHVFTNRFGTYQAYWLTENGSSAIATPYISMAKQSKDKSLDWEGVTSFLAQGFFSNDNTYLNCIKILEPASYYCFDSLLQKKKQKRYWDWQCNTENCNINNVLERVHTSLSSSLEFATKNHKVALPISGGLDSRTILGLLTGGADSYNSLWSYSYGYSKNSIETRISKKLAKVRKVPFDGYVLPNYLFDNINVIAESVDLFQCIDGTRQASMIDVLKKKSDVVIGGHWGDVWFDSMGIDDVSQLLPYYQNKIVKRGSQWLLENICMEHIKNPYEVLNDNFNSFINKYSHIDDVDFRMKVYKTDQWSFRWTLPSIRMYQAGVMPVLPFYDKNVSDTLMAIPTKLLTNRSMQIEYIKKYYPDLAKVRWQEYGTNLYLYKTVNNRNLVYRGLKKVQRTITPGKNITRNWELFYLNPIGRKKLEDIFFDEQLESILPNEKINSLLLDFYNNPTAANGYTVSMLHTFTQFLKKIH